MKDDAFPHPKGMQSFWRTETGKLDNFRSTEKLPDGADIVIIGGGYSGAAILTHLLSDPASRGKSILVIEARSLCSGATGRNGGHLKPDSYNMAAALAAKHGLEAGAEVANFESANVRAVAEYIAREKVDCDFILTRAIDVQFTEAHDRRLKAGYDKLVSAGVESTKDTFYIPPKHAEMVSGVNGAKGAFSYTAGHLWPYKLIHHMFAKALARNKEINLQTNTSVLSLSSVQDANGRWVLQTSRGTVSAGKVIVAANAYTASILPEYRGKIIPYRTVCSHIVTPGDRQPPPLLNNSYALRFSDLDFDYLIPRPDGSIIVGGARRMYFGDLDEWYGNVDDSTLIEQARGYFTGYMQRHFRGWKDSGAYTDNIWTGIMGYSSDRLPRIGEVPGRPGVFIIGGFTGHGMPQIFLASKGLAKLILHGVSFKETGIPRLFEETESRLASNDDQVLELYREYKDRQARAKL